MAKITLADIRHSGFSLETVPLLDHLRRGVLESETEVCLERARHITTYLRDLADPLEPQLLQYAKAVRCFLSNKAPRFFDGNLLAGTTTSKRLGAPVHPERMELATWPELHALNRREGKPPKLTSDEAEELKLKIFPFWMKRSRLQETRATFKDADIMHLMSRLVSFIESKAETLAHPLPCGKVVLEQGLEWVVAKAAAKEAVLRETGREEDLATIAFYQAIQEVLKGLIAYAANLGCFAALLAAGEHDPERKRELCALAEVCAQVPAKPARSFREAVNALWLLCIGLAVSPGRLDQVLYPWFRQDLDTGVLSVQEALKLVGCLWLKFNDHTDLMLAPAAAPLASFSAVSAVTIGGIGSEGEDAVNDLTYLLLRVTELLSVKRPAVNARYHPVQNTREYVRRVAMAQQPLAATALLPAPSS